MTKLKLVLLIFLWRSCDSAYFDDQPKFLTENGNFVIESAVDRNISFRLKGSSYLNINDVNVMTMMKFGGGLNQSNVPNSNLALRLSWLEEHVRGILSDDNLTTNRNRFILQRLSLIEGRMNSSSRGTNTTNLNRRLRRLEEKVNRLVERLNADNCSSNPCRNGGKCMNIFNGYTCNCPKEWTGVSCEEDVNECSNFAGTDLGCQNSATCENTPGGYNCRCTPGWHGIHCTKSTVDCLATSSYEMCGHGVCVQTKDGIGYRCICNQGWTSNGTSLACTVDVNECELPNPHCSMDPEVNCINLPGTYTCGQCPHGFTGNGHYCRDIDECAIDNGGCSTSPFVSCINTRGSSKCGQCPFGYAGDGRVCIRTSNTGIQPTNGQSRCDNPNVCHPLATCVQNLYAVTCVCPPHYVGNGIGPFGCTRSTSANSTIDGCSSSNPCQNGGTCISVGSFGYRCQCPPHTNGPRCARSVNACSPNPCQNGGTCTLNSRFLYRCTCPPSRTGRNCQMEVRSCGGVLNGFNGTLKYPLSAVYPHNARCAWLIKTDENKVLNVTFTKFNLEHSVECRFDWLQIHDGRSSASYMIGRFCGQNLPKGGNIISTQNMLYLWFRSDNSTTDGGFELKWNSTEPVCGGNVAIKSHGIISSPGSPGNYPPNRDCIWKLAAPENSRIQLHFFTLQLEPHASCNYDYLAIHNGLSTDGDLLEKYCSTMHPQPLTSPDNTLTLHFHSDGDSTDSGFQIHYSIVEGIQGCGGTFTGKSGEFGSPIQDGRYPKNIECHYLIKMPRKNETRVKLSFTTFKLEGSSSCSFDYVEIYEGNNTNAPKVGKWCGTRLPPDYSSLSNEVLVVFHTDFSFSDEGFRLKYETVCGGKFEDENGVITSPWYPNPYEDNKNCIYDIQAPLGKSIILNFTAFDIEADCDFDSLSIYDGVDSNSTLIGQYCGSNKPPVAMSTMNHLHLVFSTDSSNQGPGFRAQYSFIDAGCGGVITKANQTISPPSDDDGYKHGANCTWIIVAPPGYLIQLKFSSFDVESYTGCPYDYLKIYDDIVTSESKQPIGTYCGTQKPPILLSTTRALSIVFRSDESVAGDGFMATYDFIDGRNLCGGNIYSLTGYISSPNFPDRYPPNKDCVYVINAPNGKQIQLNIESFDLEESNGCSFDSLEIRNGASDKSPLIGSFCGTDILPRFKSFSNHMYLRFKTDSSNENKGFKISYNTAMTGCGGLFTNAQSGTISSPNYPDTYPPNMQCDYTIQVARGSTVQLLVTDLSMETSEDCNFDYISIYDGPTSASHLLGTYCHSEQIIQLESTSNSIFFRMVTDVSNQERGFEVKFNANCKRVIQDSRGAIESPNFPAHYPHYANCEWKLVPTMGNRVFIEFSHFDLEHTWSSDSLNNCMFDSLVIEERDSADVVIKSDKYCEKMPKPLNTSHTVVMKFTTDFSNTAGGFHLEYQIQGCGGILNKPEGSFTSPNYPNGYPSDTICKWTIEVEYGHLVEITFVDYDFEASQGQDCKHDGVIVSNNENATNVIQKFCGSINDLSKKSVVTSSENRVFVKFFTDLSYSGRGFSATYKSIPAKCGGLFAITHGNISSVNYPNNYPGNTNCQWLLRTEPSHTLSFKFLDFDLEDHECMADFVSIYDGKEMKNDKLLLRTCGSQPFVPDAVNQTARPGFTKPIRSTGNEMLVVMETDSSIEAKGFKASFETSCGSKIVTSSSGIIQIGHNIRWLADDCEWTITAENPSQHVSLSIMHIENEPVFQKYVARITNQSVSECVRNIFIHDGTSTRSPKVAEICSNTHPPTIISEGNSLTIALGEIGEQDFAFTFDLKAYYSVIDNACGGVFSSISGQIASPGYPKTYTNNIECEWTIRSSPGNKMAININVLEIDETEHCNGDYLEIRENNSGGKVIGIYCGNNIPPTLPHANTYWLKFRSDNDGVGRGFLLEYSYVKLVELTGESGIITSLMYPNYVYYTTGSYKWRITVGTDSLIRIKIDNCILKRDSQIQIFDGFDVASGVLSNIATDSIPTEPIISSTNILLIEFQIPTFSESKFKLFWSEVPKLGDDITNNVTNSLNCSRNSVITVHEHEDIRLKSPGFPYGYTNGEFCQWTFLPSKMGYHIGVSMVTVDLESSSNCVTDYVRIDSGSDMERFQQETRLCTMGQLLRNNRFHGKPNLRIQFNSDFSDNRTGFESVVRLDCGGNFEGPYGEITSRMTVANFSHFWMNETCTWTVSVARGRTIQFEFDRLNLAKTTDGCISYIVLKNGIHDDSPFLGSGKYCSGKPTIPRSSSNKAIVQFVRNRGFNSQNDFILKYRQVEYDCGGSFQLSYGNNSTIIASPNYPEIPSAHIECIWRVTAPNGELMKIEFLERFDLTPTPKCTSEYVEIREGSTSSSPVIGQYCGFKPPPIFSQSNMIWMKFFTDVSVPRNGFKAKVSLARCGKSVVGYSGYMSSPGFPGKGAYPMQATCDYHITGRIGTVVNITLLSLDLPEADNCSTVDHIVIYSVIRNTNGSTSMSEVTKLCGNIIPESILTFSSVALVRFVTVSSNSLYSGFRLRFQSSVDVCGARIEASNGVIQSPGYPISPDASRYCEWMITVPKGRRVKVEVLDFDMKPSRLILISTMVFSSNSDHRISFYNDFYFTSPITTLVPNNQTLPVVYSTDNTLAISALIRRSNVGHRGFKMRFSSNEPTICAGNLDDNEGSFMTPENVTKFYCEYTRKNHKPFNESQPNFGTLSIKIQEESLNASRTTCIPNLPTGISVLFPNTEKRIFYTKCPPKYDNIASPYPNTKLSLRNTVMHKYRFPYKVHNCGGVLTETMNRMTIPTLSSNYGELDCAWLYTTNTERNIQLILNAPAMNCETDYINIYRGSTPNRPKLNRICGDADRNRSITISGQQVFVEYHSDNYNPNTPFSIDVVTSNGICGGILDPPNYIFSSPKVGTKYPPNTECEWNIRAQNGYHVGLVFTNRFMIETSNNCTKDYVKVFNKVDGEFKELKRLCGRDTPPYLNSTGREMKVLFHTDADGAGDGFSAEWFENCGGTFKATDMPQIITSPRYPENYPRNIVCNYSIIAENGKSVSVKFLAFDLETTNAVCIFDNITVYKQSPYMISDNMEEVGTYCLNNSITTFRYTSRIDIVFRTDSYIERSGFKFEYSTDRCGGNITEPTQIGSLHDDNNEGYLPLASCIWFITAPRDKKITVRFEQFDLEQMGGCYLDYVEVYDGHSTISENRKARLCGNLTEHMPSISVDSNKAIVKFASDATINEKGFIAAILFTKNCNQDIALGDGISEYTLNKLYGSYEPNMNCEYVVRAPVGYVIEAKFNQMHLRPCTNNTLDSNSCTCDYLNIRDGGGPFAESFGTFCGNENPPDIITTTPRMYLRFVTDNEGSGTGFSLNLKMKESPCGRTAYNLSDSFNSITIKSPMYNSTTYQPNLNCIWEISVEDDHLVDIHFDQFDLESDEQNKCTNDFLEITDDESNKYVREGLGENIVFSGSSKLKNQYFYTGRQWPTAAHRYCGNNTPIDYLSTYKKIYVHFKSNDDKEGLGFTFTAKIFADCARNYSQPQGRLFGKELMDCDSYITVPENHTISLYFAILDMRLSDDCTENNTPLKIYNARNNELIKSYCGESVPSPLFTTTNQLRLHFKNTSLIYSPSYLYDITYLATDKGCGGELYNYGGTFSSPGYPNTDRNNSDCTWTINVPMNLYVALQFSVFDMGPRSTCELNYVEIIENDENLAATKFCGADNPAPYKARSSQVKVHFKSSLNFAGTGWVINFMAVHENSIVNKF
ncbi:cubilin homolog [Contarinia nasturtii]|uniref:cubilin homolog n=1 Tax=Contarinia nasturtii TaxID=265458 RepID=UPI0012D41D6E|nr:cubilin homolog [Contarinia nasturtii]